MKNRKMIVDSLTVDDASPVYVIAEIGHNHQGNVETCKELFRAAKEAGASAVKLQKRDNRALFTQAMYDSAYNSENAYAPTYGEHREYLEFDRAQYLDLKAYAAEIDITFFSTAFDFPSADLLNEIDLPAFKIASGDLRNIPLLRHIAGFGKPMFISTGGGSMDDVRRMHDAVMPINDNICIMQCTSGYPPAFEELNVQVIATFREAFPDAVIGFSSHDSGIAMPLLGYALGARAVEKHFTLNRASRGTDHAFSLEPVGLKKLVRDLTRARLAMGDGVKKTYDSERAPLHKMGKKIVARHALKAGGVLTFEDVIFKSPSDGAAPYLIDQMIGMRLKTDLAADDNVTFEVLEEAAKATA